LLDLFRQVYQVVRRIEVARTLLTQILAAERERVGIGADQLPSAALPGPAAVDGDLLRVGAPWRDDVREHRVLRTAVVTHPPFGRRHGRGRAERTGHGLAGVDRAGALDVGVVPEVLRRRLQDVLR